VPCLVTSSSHLSFLIPSFSSDDLSFSRIMIGKAVAKNLTCDEKVKIILIFLAFFSDCLSYCLPVLFTICPSIFICPSYTFSHIFCCSLFSCLLYFKFFFALYLKQLLSAFRNEQYLPFVSHFPSKLRYLK
jgi:hypothetical protein